MLPEALISHQTPFRTRIKIPSKKGDAAYFDLAKQKLGGTGGLCGIETNPLTGSILFTGAGADSVAESGLKNDLFNITGETARPRHLARTVVKGFGGFNKKIESLTGGDMDAADLAFAALLVFGIVEIARGNLAAPAWYTAFWYALNIFLKSMPSA